MDFLFIFNGLWFERMELKEKVRYKLPPSIYQLDCFIRFDYFDDTNFTHHQRKYRYSAEVF